MRYLAPLLLLPGLALAQPAPSASLPATSAFDRALSQAYLYNPQLAAERQRLRETDEGVPRALSGWRPSVTFQTAVGAAAVWDDLDKVHVPEQRTPDEDDLKLNQPLYTSGRVRAQVNQAEALVIAERATLRATEAAVLLAAATAYLDVVQNTQIVLLNRNQATVLERTLRATQQQFAAGSVTQTDVDQARARLADQRGTLAQSEGELAASRARFEQQVGTLPGELDTPRLLLPLPSSRETALAAVAAGNFDVAQARAAQEASRQGIDVARAGLLPELSLQLRGTRIKESDVQQLHERDYVAEAGVVLSVPLYQGGGPAAQTRQAKEAAEQSRLQVDIVARAARQQLQTAWDMLEASRERMRQATTSIQANTVAVRGVARQQTVGARTLLDVLNAQQELVAAQVSLARATHDEQHAVLEIAAVGGRLTAEQLGLHVPIYDATRHYNETRDRWQGLSPAP